MQHWAEIGYSLYSNFWRTTTSFQRRTTSYDIVRRRIDVETSSCVHWVSGEPHKLVSITPSLAAQQSIHPPIHYLIKRQSCHHIETSQLICRANHLTGFYMMANFSFNELIPGIQHCIKLLKFCFLV